MEKEKKASKKPILLAVIITAIITSILTFAITSCVNYFSTPMYIVFYQTECVENQVSVNYAEEQVCAYFRLNSKANHTLEVGDFSIFHDAKYIKAYKVEYFNQTITTQFYTYPNQPILKVYFNVPHEAADGVVFVKYQETSMRLGEFAVQK